MADALPFREKVIGITGAASGIGLATCHYLIARGASISLANIRQEPLDAATADIRKAFPSARLLATVIDVRKPLEIAAWMSSHHLGARRTPCRCEPGGRDPSRHRNHENPRH